MRISSCLVRLCILTALALPLNLGCQASAPHGGSAVPTNIKVTPFLLEPQPLPDAPDNPSETFQTLLLAEASLGAEEALAHGGLGEITGGATITGTVQIPVSLPPDVKGIRAHRQKGRLAAATVKLLGPDGKSIREAEASLSWHEVRWLVGAPHFRRYRSPEEVLRDAAHKVVARAVERLGAKPR